MRRGIAICLAAVLLLGALAVGSFAANTPEVTVSSGSVKAGETVDLTVTMSGNPGMAAYMLYIYYDTDTFAVDPSRDISAGSDFAGGILLGNDLETARKNSDEPVGDSSKDGVLALWCNSTGTNTTKNGSMLRIRLQAKDTAANGSYTISLGYDADNTINEDGGKVALQVSGGTVTVTGGAADKPEHPAGAVDSTGGGGGVVDFSDIAGNWAEDYIVEANAQGLVYGYNGVYRPNDTMTRAEFVTILYRACGSPKPAKAASFTDLTQTWYRDPIAWAEENQVVNGVGNGKFDPGGPVTREQLVTILFRLSGGQSGMESMFTSAYDDAYTDAGQISAYAKPAVYWSIYHEILCGQQSLTVPAALAPRAAATRAQIAVMIVRYLDME